MNSDANDGSVDSVPIYIFSDSFRLRLDVGEFRGCVHVVSDIMIGSSICRLPAEENKLWRV